MGSITSLRTFRSRAKSLPDLLNFAAVIADGVILGKDGSLCAGWYYEGFDNESATEDELNATATKINTALSRLGTGWATHHDAIRVPSHSYPSPEANHFSDPISALIDNERRSQFEAEGEHYETYYAFVVTYLPPLRSSAKVGELMFATGATTQAANLGTRVLEQFEAHLRELEDALSSSFLFCRRMRGQGYSDESGHHVNDELLQYLHYTITGELHRFNLPAVPMYLDAVLGNRDFWGGTTPKIDKQFILPIAIDGFPLESYATILRALDKLPHSYRWSNRFIYLDTTDAESALKKYYRKWNQQKRGFVSQIFNLPGGQVNMDAASMAADADDALTEARGGLVRYGYYTSTIIVLHKSKQELEELARVFRRAIQDAGFSCRVETINAIETWLGSIPSHVLPNLRRPLIHTFSLAHFLPSSATWSGAPYCPCPFYPKKSPPLLHANGTGYTPFRLNLHVDDLGHTLIFGPTGSGKSTLLALICASFLRYANATIFAFDKGRSLLALTLAARGSHYDISTETTLRFAPLSRIDQPKEIVWAEEWVASLLELQNVFTTPTIKNEIHRALELLALAPPHGRTITHLVSTIQDPTLRAALAPYTLNGVAGRLLDGETDNFDFQRFNTFEIEEVMNLGPTNALPILAYLFHCVERRLNGQPAMLVLDEAWLMLGHEKFRDKIREWAKVLRKANCALVLATQSLSDAHKSGILDVLLESCPTKILLANPNADIKGEGSVLGPKDLYLSIGLNEAQIALLKHATPKRHYYVWSSAGSRLINLILGPVALSFVGVSSKDHIAKIHELRQHHGEQWPWRWLDHRSVRYDHLAVSPISTGQNDLT